MDGYERLSTEQAGLVWDAERFNPMPEQERELLVEEIERITGNEDDSRDPCDLMTAAGSALISKIV